MRGLFERKMFEPLLWVIKVAAKAAAVAGVKVEQSFISAVRPITLGCKQVFTSK